MKRPETKGWYWVKIPKLGKMIVLVMKNEFGSLSAYQVYSYGITLLSNTKGWRWLGRAVLEKEK